MAGPKSHPFTIWTDTGVPTPDPGTHLSFDDTVAAPKLSCTKHDGDGDRYTQPPPARGEGMQRRHDSASHISEDGGAEPKADSDDWTDEDRRESGMTTTSISSLPESAYDTDLERARAWPYTPPVMRPPFMRPESVRRMQMASSPPPLGSRSPRASVLRHARSRTHTPRSVKAAHARGSPRGRRATDALDLEEPAYFPLVLLHVTLLPVSLRWSMESMHELLPAATIENLQLLRAKVSETVRQRGILIPHPREEYELLEERLLEALELKEERVTKCGHFRGRESVGSHASTVSSGRDSDSGFGSGAEGFGGDMCATCHRHVKHSKSGVGTGARLWTVKVFAANGLMRAPAWASAWSEMERVDVEIFPWIDEEMRRKLDERREREDAEDRARREDENDRIREIVEEEVRVAHEQAKRAQAAEDSMRAESMSTDAKSFRQTYPSMTPAEAITPTTDLPRVYRPSEIPLSLLLKNYVTLLARDRRNVAIFFLAVLLFLFAIRTNGTGDGLASPLASANRSDSPALHQLATDRLIEMAANATTELELGATNVLTQNVTAPTLGSLTVDENTGETVDSPPETEVQQAAMDEQVGPTAADRSKIGDNGRSSDLYQVEVTSGLDGAGVAAEAAVKQEAPI